MRIIDILAILDNLNIHYSFSGHSDVDVVGYSSIYNYKEKTITWLRSIETLSTGECNFIDKIQCIVTDDKIGNDELFVSHIIVDDPRLVFFEIVDKVWGDKHEAKIASSAIIEDGASLGENVTIGAYTNISSCSFIGDNCVIGSNVTIKGRVRIGHDCIIQSGAVIGEDGFAFIKGDNKLTFVKHFGGVTIGNYVSIGANTCVCRGTIDDTLVKDYAKIDNLCHIAHNTIIGERSEVIAGVVVMGSTLIGSDCWIATSMIRDQCHVGDNVTVGMGAVVVKDIEDGQTVIGNPAKAFVKSGK